MFIGAEQHRNAVDRQEHNGMTQKEFLKTFGIDMKDVNSLTEEEILIRIEIKQEE